MIEFLKFITRTSILLLIVTIGIGAYWRFSDITPYVDQGPDVCTGGIDGVCKSPIVCRYYGIEGWKTFVVSHIEDCPAIKMIRRGQASDDVSMYSGFAPPTPQPVPAHPGKTAGRRRHAAQPSCRKTSSAPPSDVYGPRDDRAWVLKPAALPPCAPKVEG